MKLRVDAKLSKNQGGRPQGDSGRLERDVKSNTSEKASTSTSHATLPNFRGKRVEMDTAECRDEEDEERQFSSEKTNRKSKLLYKQAKYIKGLEYKVSESEEKVKELSFTLVDKGVENALNAARCKELEKEIKQLRNNANKSDITEEEQNKIDTINEEKDKLIADVDEANASIKDLERKGKDDQNKMQEMRLKMDKSSAGYSSLQQRMEEATDMNEKLLQELTTMNQDLETQDNLHQELQSNIGVLDDERNKLAADLDEANASIKDLEQKRKDDQDTMRETRLEMDKSNADYSSLRQRIKEATDTNEKLLQKFDNLNQEQETQDNLHQELKELQSNIGVLDDERNKVIADCDEANASIKDLEETHKDDQKAIQEMRLKMDESSAGYSSLQQRMKEATDMNERLQKELTNLDQDLETQHSIQLTIDILEDERNKVIADLDEANASIKDLEEKRKDDQNTMQEVRLEMDKCNAGYSSLQHTNERLKQEVTNLNQGLECREKTSACSDCIRLREKQIMLNKDIEVKKHQFEDCVSSLRQELEAQIKKSEDNAADKNHILEIEKKNNQFQQELFKLNLKLKSQTEEKVQAVKGNDTLQSELKKIGSTIVCMKLEIQHLEEQKILTAKDYDDLMREKRSVELEREELAGRLDALIMNEVDDSNTNVAGVTTIEKFERTEEENQMLRALLEEGECNTSSDDLEELEERLFTIVQVKDTEIAILAEERSGLLAETSALGDRVQMLEGELKRLQDEHGARSSGIDKLKKKRDRKKKTIEERLRAYESSSSVCSVVSKNKVRPRRY
jgi:chromosome segregation ATPase